MRFIPRNKINSTLQVSNKRLLEKTPFSLHSLLVCWIWHNKFICWHQENACLGLLFSNTLTEGQTHWWCKSAELHYTQQSYSRGSGPLECNLLCQCNQRTLKKLFCKLFHLSDFDILLYLHSVWVGHIMLFIYMILMDKWFFFIRYLLDKNGTEQHYWHPTET